MSTELAGATPAARAHRSRRVLAVSALGPVTALAGLIWAIAQPYRITLLDPVGESFWWLAVQPPLLVIAGGALFHFLVAPGLIEDVERGRADE